EFQTSLSHPTAITRLIAEKGMELFKLNYNWHKPLRSVGIRAINLYENGCGYQFSLFENYGQENRLQKIDTSIDNLRARFGNDSIGRASLLKEKSCNMKIEKAED
ncbi:MAG: DNA polymerase IV, partial [Oscillospiraceae bacterium]